MRKNRLGKSFIVLVLACVIFLMSVSPAYAYTSGIGTLVVDEWDRSYAYAATYSYGYVSVSLSVSVYNQQTHTYTGDGNGGTSITGFIHTSVGAGSPIIITAANSYHTDSDGYKVISWNPNTGYY